MRNIISTTVVASILVLGALCSSARGGGCCYPWENPYGDVAWFCVDVPNETVCGYYPGGVYQGDSTFCLGDNNADGHDDLCAPPAKKSLDKSRQFSRFYKLGSKLLFGMIL